MDDRTKLHTFLAFEFPDLNIYYNPTESTLIQYPCIVYTMIRLDASHADSRVYNVGTIFQVSLMHTESEFEGLKKMFNIPYATQVNTFKSKDITNNVFNIRVGTI